MFIYTGGHVSREELEEAINVFVKIEEEFKGLCREAYELKNADFDEETVYAGIEAKYTPDRTAARKASTEYARQIKPNDLKSMQDEFYRIVNRGDATRRSVAASLLNSAWDGIGNWMK